MIGIGISVAQQRGVGVQAAFGLSLTGADGGAVIGTEATISYTITPDNGTDTAKWSASSNPADAATYGTGATPTSLASGDGFTGYLHVTDGGETVTQAFSIILDVPTVIATDALVGRTLTITVDSTTNSPTTTLTTLTVDGVDVLGDATGTGPWSYVLPDDLAPQPIAWTVTATNSNPTSATSSGSEIVPANLFAPVASGAIADQTWPVSSLITPVDVSADFAVGTGPITYALAPSSAALPAGITLSSAGLIEGTPTTGASLVNIVVRGTNAYGFADTAFGVTVPAASATPAWLGWTDEGRSGASFSRTHSAGDIGKLKVYFFSGDSTTKNFTPTAGSGAGWTVGGQQTATNCIGGWVYKILDGDDNLEITGADFCVAGSALIENVTGTPDSSFAFSSFASPPADPPAVSITGGVAKDVLAVVFNFTDSSVNWVPDNAPAGYSNPVSSASTHPNTIHVASKLEIGTTSFDPPIWGTTGPAGRAGVFTIAFISAGGAANTIPVANADTYATAFQTAKTFDPRTNDTDSDGDVLTITAASVAGAEGGVTFTGTSITFTPATGFSGPATVSYTISDGTATASSTATITVASEVVQAEAVTLAASGFEDLGRTGATAPTYTDHGANAAVGKLCIYFMTSSTLGKDYAPDAASIARGWALGGSEDITNHSGGFVYKLLDGNDDLTIVGGTFTKTARGVISNAAGTLDANFVRSGGGNVPNPPAVNVSDGPRDVMSIVFHTSPTEYYPDVPPTGYTNEFVTGGTYPGLINLAAGVVTGKASIDPPNWGTTIPPFRAGVWTITVHDDQPVPALRTGTFMASYEGMEITADESLNWGRTADVTGMFMVKDGPINIISDAPSSADYNVTGWTALSSNLPVTATTGTIIGSGGNNVIPLVSNGLVKGTSIASSYASPTRPQGWSVWNRNSNMYYDPTLNISPTASGNGAYVWPVNEVLVKGIAVPGDPNIYDDPVGGLNSTDNQFRYNRYFMPIVHLSEVPRDGVLMPPLIGWDGVNLHSIEPEPAGPPASAYTWHHADLSALDPANLPLNGNGNYDVLQENINQFYGAMNTWTMSGQKQGGWTGSGTQTWYYESMGNAAKQELKYLLGSDSLENKKSTIAAWLAYGLQGLSGVEYFNLNTTNRSKGHTMGLVPAICLLYVLFPTDTALRARIRAYFDLGEHGVPHAGMETQNRHYVQVEDLHATDGFTDKHALRGRYTSADIGKPDWFFLTNGYADPETAKTRTGHTWNEVYKGIDWSGVGGMAPLIHQFGGFDAFSTRPAFQAYEDRVWHLKQDAPISAAIHTIRVTDVTSPFSVGESVTIARSSGSPDFAEGTDTPSVVITAITQTANSVMLHFAGPFEETYTDGTYDMSTRWGNVVSSDGGGAGLLGGNSIQSGIYSAEYIGGLGGLPLAGKLTADNFGDVAGLYPTVMLADPGYTPWTGTPEQQPAPRIALSGSTIVVTPSTFRGLNGEAFVQVDYRWQLMSADYLNDAAWTVQLDGGDTTFTTPALAAGNYRVSCRVVNTLGAGTWSSNFFEKEYLSDNDYTTDGMATITVP